MNILPKVQRNLVVDTPRQFVPMIAQSLVLFDCESGLFR